ncbi:MAG: hypothetical protein M3P34_10870 [Actinomycetota bacterium]|nr:hypothetical protein [Actinomycetota bacterium]
MTAIFANDESGWSVLEADAFEKEEKLHDLIEEAPHLMPLSGAPRIIILGREVTCGSGSADLLAIEESGRPVVIEIKLAQNPEARRAVVAQVLSYASFLKGLSAGEFDHRLAAHLAKRGSTAATVAEFVAQSDQTTSFNPEAFLSSLESHLAEGSFRLVLVLDSAPADLVQVVGYLEAITQGRVDIDLVTVSAYHVAGTLLLVPQRVDPANNAGEPASKKPAAGGAPPKSITVRGHAEFMASIAEAAAPIRPELERLAGWARQLEQDGLATLYNSTGVDSSRWTLSPRVKGHDAGLAAVWNDNGAYLTVYRTVFERLAPTALASLEQAGIDVRQGNSVKQPSGEVLDILREAYTEAGAKKLSGT